MWQAFLANIVKGLIVDGVKALSTVAAKGIKNLKQARKDRKLRKQLRKEINAQERAQKFDNNFDL